MKERLGAPQRSELREFVVRVAVVAGAVTLLCLTRQARQALLLMFAAVFATIFGGVGVVFAAPLTVLVIGLVKKLNFVDALQQEVELPTG